MNFLNVLYILSIVYVSITILSVWLLRKNRKTIYRGGGAVNLLEEFQNYGLSKNVMIGVGVCKVSLSILLLLGLRYSSLVLPSIFFLALFMLAAVFFHLKIKDPIIPTVPSLLLLFFCLVIACLRLFYL